MTVFWFFLLVVLTANRQGKDCLHEHRQHKVLASVTTMMNCRTGGTSADLKCLPTPYLPEVLQSSFEGRPSSQTRVHALSTLPAYQTLQAKA
jgi:hypothetical protein